MGKIVNRARMTVAGVPGTGVISLNAAVAGHQSFAAAGVANGDVVSYVAESNYSGGVATVWECGVGTYSSTGPALTRTSISSSSSGGAAVTLASDAQVFISPLAVDFPTRAWVNFNGQGSVSIRASYNVSSITDNGVGDYTVNFTSAMPDANYAIAGMAQYDTSGTAVVPSLVAIARFTTAMTSAGVRIGTIHSGSAGNVDFPVVTLVVFR